MRSYKEITLRYLKGQKNRTLLTIFGIILSVALITAIGTIIVSTRGAMINQAIREDGAYHGMIMDIDEETMNKFKNHVEVEELGLMTRKGSAPIAETTEEERVDYGAEISHRYLEIYSYDEKSTDLISINLKEGRLPTRADEIIIEYWIADYFHEDIKVGDNINLSLEENPGNHQEYTVVGFIQPSFVWRGNLITQGITGFDSGGHHEKYNVAFTLKDIKGAQKKISSLVDDLGIEEGSYLTNYRLLRLSAEHVNQTFNKSIIGLLAFIVAIIMISAVAVIYNSFNISVLERISQFGLLRSIGASPNQIKGIVLREAALLSFIGIPIGLLAGVFAMKIVLHLISLIQSDMYLFRDMEIIMSMPVFIVSIALGFITVFLSALGPTRRAGKVSPLEAIRNTEDIKQRKLSKKRNSFLIEKILGIEGEIAYKNLSRNRKRFIITVFSMVISIALFITFSTFSDLMFDMTGQDQVSDFEIYAGIGEIGEEELQSRLREIGGIDRIYTLKRNNGELLLEDGQINDGFRKRADYLFNEKQGDLTKVHNAEVNTLGDENLEELREVLIHGQIDIEEMNEKNGVLVLNNTFFYGDGSNSDVYQGYNLEVGDIIPFGSYDFHSVDKEVQHKDLEVVGVLEKNIIEPEYNYNGSVYMITTEQVFDNIYYHEDLSNARSPGASIHILMEEDGDRAQVTALLEELHESGLQYIDREVQAQENRNLTIIISIFLYGFVSIITLISGINIVNTISTNILLRSKEIAMIKAVGMTQSGVKKMIAYEGVFYGLYASVIGGILGIGSSYIIFRLLLGISKFEYKMPWLNVAIAIIGSMTIAILAGVYPLRKLNKQIIVESMKADN